MRAFRRSRRTCRSPTKRPRRRHPSRPTRRRCRISPTSAGRCGFGPSCSAFAVEAVRDCGPLLGVALIGDRLYIDYVFSPPQLRGTGAAGRLMSALSADARDKGLKITPVCGYAAAWLGRSDEFRDLVA